MKKTDPRVAIVTGAAQGIGLAIAKRFLSDGLRVVLIDKNREALKEVKESEFFKDINSSSCLFLEVDIADNDAINHSVNTVLEKWNHIDVLVNNAGIRKETAVEYVTKEEWDTILSVNLGGTFFYSQAVMETMKKQQRGRIINISSFGGQAGPLTSGAHYCASKAGQLVVTKVLARSLAEQGITVNAIAPAAINTPEMDHIDPGKLKKMKEGIPVKRFGESEEIAEMASYIASEAAGFITGATFDINGGLQMR
ncbi:SDR family NAD(P)-dependent oxidoreductase [Salibacterium aidingense]|uniref:SDR family NAD(P)-dependent oxidoreductase n=1 Tax=Salibacterium aidingense TaxID=384933 RepID=UPI000422D564|nr:SDR family NAD(P)-dependent oxidoreductase [Salibacterium aidingense]